MFGPRVDGVGSCRLIVGINHRGRIRLGEIDESPDGVMIKKTRSSTGRRCICRTDEARDMVFMMDEAMRGMLSTVPVTSRKE